MGALLAEPPGLFISPEPQVELTAAFVRPFDNAVATARTCYSPSGIVTAQQVAGDGEPEDKQQLKRQRRDGLARSIYEAGHHTTLQHAHFQFALSNVSRHFIWGFLHSHPFYNSEQVSQRYVEVKPDAFAIPPLDGRAQRVYLDTVDQQVRSYQHLIDLLTPMVAREYWKIFPARRKNPIYKRDIKKKAQEIARYVLPISTFAYLYHTVSGITLLRYWRLSRHGDTPLEQRIVIGKMVDRLLEHDPSYEAILQEPLPVEETPEHAFFEHSPTQPEVSLSFVREFDDELGEYTSKLVDWKNRNEEEVAQSVREVYGVLRQELDDDEAIRLAIDPARNRYLGENMNVTTHSKLSRALFHASYTFRKRLSHAADSQDQRHRLTPASRPILAAHLSGEPDYVLPALVGRSPVARAFYQGAMENAWRGYRELLSLGVPTEFAAYLLPNAVSVRFTESADLLNLHHKLKMRLCYNAQEEIWRASLDEAMQIAEVNPRIGEYLLPPCSLRLLSKTRPICPEGKRYCGVPVWKLQRAQYQRWI